MLVVRILHGCINELVFIFQFHYVPSPESYAFPYTIFISLLVNKRNHRVASKKHFYNIVLLSHNRFLLNVFWVYTYINIVSVNFKYPCGNVRHIVYVFIVHPDSIHTSCRVYLLYRSI